MACAWDPQPQLLWALDLNFCEPLPVDLLVCGLRMGPQPQLLWAFNLNFFEPLSVDMLVDRLRRGPSISTYVSPQPQLS